MFLDILQLLQFENSDARVKKNYFVSMAPVTSGARARNDVGAEGKGTTTQKIKIQ